MPLLLRHTQNTEDAVDSPPCSNCVGRKKDSRPRSHLVNPGREAAHMEK